MTEKRQPIESNILDELETLDQMKRDTGLKIMEADSAVKEAQKTLDAHGRTMELLSERESILRQAYNALTGASSEDALEARKRGLKAPHERPASYDPRSGIIRPAPIGDGVDP